MTTVTAAGYVSRNGTVSLPADAPEVLERFNAHLHLVKPIARGIHRWLAANVEFDDVMNAGREGLFDAARRFDPTRGHKFLSFARFRIRGQIYDLLRNESIPDAIRRRAYAQLAAEELREDEETIGHATLSASGMGAEDADTALLDELSAIATSATMALMSRGRSEGDNPEADAAQREQIAVIAKLLSTEGSHRQEIIARHYFKGQSLEQIAEELELSKGWVSKVHASTLEWLGVKLRLLENGGKNLSVPR